MSPGILDAITSQNKSPKRKKGNRGGKWIKNRNLIENQNLSNLSLSDKERKIFEESK